MRLLCREIFEKKKRCLLAKNHKQSIAGKKCLSDRQFDPFHWFLQPQWSLGRFIFVLLKRSRKNFVAQKSKKDFGCFLISDDSQFDVKMGKRAFVQVNEQIAEILSENLIHFSTLIYQNF